MNCSSILAPVVQLICTILTFLGALGLLWLTQWFSDKHKRTELLTTKLESLYESLTHLMSLEMPETTRGITAKEAAPILRDQANAALAETRRISMIIGLHFPSLEVFYFPIRKSAQRAYTAMYSVDTPKEVVTLMARLDEMKTLIADLQDTLVFEMSDLTERVFPLGRKSFKPTPGPAPRGQDAADPK